MRHRTIAGVAALAFLLSALPACDTASGSGTAPGVLRIINVSPYALRFEQSDIDASLPSRTVSVATGCIYTTPSPIAAGTRVIPNAEPTFGVDLVVEVDGDSLWLVAWDPHTIGLFATPMPQ